MDSISHKDQQTGNKISLSTRIDTNARLEMHRSRRRCPSKDDCLSPPGSGASGASHM